MRRVFLLLTAVVTFSVCFNRGVGADLAYGPALDDFPLTLGPGHRLEVLGPLFYDEHKEEERTWALPPLMSYYQDTGTDVSEFDLLYPLLTYDRYGKQFRWQLGQLLSFAGGETQTETNRNRLTIFPFYFQQRSSDPSQNYTAVLPFYGHLEGHLFRDEVWVVAWPLYAKTRKGEVITKNYVVPFFDVRYGPGLSGWQLWPLVGHEHKDVTTHTNMFGDTESIPGHDKVFALWPIYFNEHTGLGTTNMDWQQGVLPLYSFERSPMRDSTTVIWPFFSHVTDREKKYVEWDAPWPFIVHARGEGKNTTRVFPLFSHARSPTLESDFYLWPIYKFDRITSAPLDRRRTRIAFFLFNDTLERSTETGKSKRRTDLWPLFTRQRDLNGSTRLQLLAPLEVWTQGSHKIERDWSPVWSLWRSERNAENGANSQSLLWNLYRRDSGPDKRRVSALFGLFQYRKDPTRTQVRLFYIPFSKHRQAAPAGHADKN